MPEHLHQVTSSCQKDAAAIHWYAEFNIASIPPTVGLMKPDPESSHGMFDRMNISFRPLVHTDLQQMFQWHRNASVSRWYGSMPESFAEIESKYLPRISGDVPVRCYIVDYDRQPVGYIQTYRIDHDAEYSRALGVDRDAAGVDLFIGENDFRYRGFGALMLQEFVKRVVFEDSTVSCCVIAPVESNKAAIRAYRKAGFRHTRTVPVPGGDVEEYVMLLWPDELDSRIDDLERMRSE
jgi:aminoglycoside 6'-N-acetyltransferase